MTRVDVFERIFLVFLGLGTLVGIIVTTYTLYNAYKYRDTDEAGDDEDLPSVGELPTGGKGGKKLFLSFGISAVIVISLVIWTYTMLLYVESPDETGQEKALEGPVEVTGEGFAWFFEYDNGVQPSTLRVPANERVWLEVTSGDVWHTFGIPDQRVKADAIPGEYDETWFEAENTGTYEIRCYELCGEFHTSMVSSVEVMEPQAFEEWMDEQLTLTLTVQNANETGVSEGYNVELVSQESDFAETYSADQFDENGTIELTDLPRGGVYNVTVSPTDGGFEPTTTQFDVTGPTTQAVTIESGNTTANETNGAEAAAIAGGGH